MKVGDLVKMKKGWSSIGLIVDIIGVVSNAPRARVLWPDLDGDAKTLEYLRDLVVMK
jgi:hypothetical protein